MTRHRRSLVTALIPPAMIAALVVGLHGCRLAAPRLGPTESAARTNADELFASLAGRFGPVTRGPRLARIRPRYIKGSLSPSRIWDDTLVWTSMAPAERRLEVFGGPTPAGFALTVRRDAPAPSHPAESRHVMVLHRLSDGEYEWSSRDELATGTMTAAELGELLRAALAAGEGRSEEAARADYRAGFPHTTAALGRLFTLDTLRAATLRDGTTMRTYIVRMSPDRVRRWFPSFADYLEKYVTPARFRLTVLDRDGASWLESAGEDDRFVLRVRTREGRLMPLAGPPRAAPDSLRLRVEFFAKVLFFHVGVTDLEGTLTTISAPHERAWDIRFQREPDWHFPLAADRLLRTPLRRPFEGPGVHLRYEARDSSGMQTLLAREMRIAVKESAIVRWIGMLGNSAMSDVTRQVEFEKDRFTGDVFLALRADFATLLAAGPDTAAAIAGR